MKGHFKMLVIDSFVRQDEMDCIPIFLHKKPIVQYCNKKSYLEIF